MVKKQRCDECGEKSLPSVGLFRVTGMTRRKYDSLPMDKRQGKKRGETVLCKECQKN